MDIERVKKSFELIEEIKVILKDVKYIDIKASIDARIFIDYEGLHKPTNFLVVRLSHEHKDLFFELSENSIILVLEALKSFAITYTLNNDYMQHNFVDVINTFNFK